MPSSAPEIPDSSAYVAAAARLHDLTLDAERLTAVGRQFALLSEMADRVLAVELPDDAEPAPVYRP
jgi:hypothetical protein